MKYAFVNGVILDGTQDMEPQSGKIILVDGEKITAIVDAGVDTSGYEKIDLGGKYIMPGLINMHIQIPHHYVKIPPLQFQKYPADLHAAARCHLRGGLQ